MYANQTIASLTTGADGTNGVDGQDGAHGTNGVDGQDGADGTHGFDGLVLMEPMEWMQDGTSILINVVSSTACLSGGNTFEIGSDDDADGVLSISEVHVTVDICDGAEGPHPTGADGQDGSNALFSMTPESTGSNCANGGTRIDVGVDDNSNGVSSE